MKSNNHPRLRALWVIPPVALGILVFMFMAGEKQAPQKAQQGEPAYAVRTITAPMVDLVPQAEGYGAVRPAKVWTAVAQVSGRIIELHPKLRDGEILPAGTPLFRIDPVDYELNLAQSLAELAELGVQEENAEASLAIEQRNLSLSQRELSRMSKLVEKGTASQNDADTAERTMLGRRTAMQNIKNTLALIPTQRKLLEAKLMQAERDLQNTSVSAPFNLRIAKLAIESDQYVSKGQNLFEGDSVDRVEIIAQVAMSSLRNLFIGRQDAVPNVQQMNQQLAQFTGFQPLVQMDLGNHIAQWEAEFVRFSDNVDGETRTIGVVIAVDKPMEKIKPGYRPPLSKGMFVQVILRGHTQKDRIVIPRSTVRDGKVYLVDQEQRLKIQPVKLLFNQRQLSIVDQGIDQGQQVIVSDLIPAVEGMLLRPSVDEKIQQELSALTGEKQ